MSRLTKISSGLFAFFIVITVLHVWQNIGFDKLWFIKNGEDRLQVGFLPVT